MNVEDFRLLYEYNSWANRRTLDACSALNTEQFTRDLGSSFPSVRDTLSHICEVESLWLERWQGHSGTFFRPGSDFPTFASLRSRWDEVEPKLSAYVNALKPEDIARVIEHKTTKGVPQSAPLWQMLQHLVESRHLSPRPGRRDASPTRRKGELHRLDLLLPRTRSEGLRVMCFSASRGAALACNRRSAAARIRGCR